VERESNSKKQGENGMAEGNINVEVKMRYNDERGMGKCFELCVMCIDYLKYNGVEGEELIGRIRSRRGRDRQGRKAKEI
jgi:hypothetical protein